MMRPPCSTQTWSATSTHQLDIVLDQKRGAALGLDETANEVDDARNEVDLHARGRLVEQQHPRVGRDRSQQREQLLLSERQFAGRPLSRALKRDSLQQLVGPSRDWRAPARAPPAGTGR